MLRRRPLLPPLLLALAITSSPAHADGPVTCVKPDLITGICLVAIPAPSPNPSTQPVSGSPNAGTAPKCTRYPSIAVPCSDPTFGFWSNSLEVYCSLSTPQPSINDAIWAGHEGKGGAVYDCTNPFGGNFSSGQLWLPQGTGRTVSPEEAAQAIVRRMNLRGAEIGIVPEDKPGRIGAVGAPVYMWTKPGPTTFGPQVLTGSAGGVTITATAKVDRIVWSMGDGNTVTCRTPGTVYQDRYGLQMSPDCGYRYTRTSAGKPGDAYPIVATSYWIVNWTGPGTTSGRIMLDLQSRTKIVVGELQALVTN